MDWHWKRPMVPVTLLFAAGILLNDLVAPLPLTLWIGAVGALLLAFLWARGRTWLLVAGIFFSGAANHATRSSLTTATDLRELSGQQPELASLRGRLVRTPEIHESQRDDRLIVRTLAEVEVTEAALARGAWQPAEGTVTILSTGPVDTNFFGGQLVELAGVLQLPPAAQWEGGFDFRENLRRRGIYRQLVCKSARDWKVIGSPGTAPLADRFLRWGEIALAHGLPKVDETVRLEWALALGDRQVLKQPEVMEPFVQAATYHIFAVDGLRIAIVFGICFALLRALRLPRLAAGLLALPLIWAYVALTGWPASAIRAAVMLSVVIGGWWWRRPTDLINSLFVAAFLILGWDPQQLFQAGFQMSFFVVLAILLLMPPLDRFGQRLLRIDPLIPRDAIPRWRRLFQGAAHFILDLTLVSFAAWVGSIPLTAYYFNIFTPVSVPANVMVVPATVLALICNFVSLLFAAWLPAVSELFNHAGWLLMEGIRLCSEWCARWPYAYEYVAAPSWPDIAFYYLLLLGVATGWLWRGGRWWKWPAVIIIAVGWGWNFYEQCRTTRVTVLPLGSGSAVYCDAPGDRSDMLVDCGNEVPADFTLKPFLRAHGVDQLARLVLTHGDVQRVGGAQKVIGGFDAKEVITSHAPSRSLPYRQVLAQLARDQRPWLRVSRDTPLGDWHVLHPSRTEQFPQGDDNAIVLLGVFQGVRVLLLSDLGPAGQAALLQRQGDLQAEVVVTGVPEHGEPLGNLLLNRINPRVIILTDTSKSLNRAAREKLQERLKHWGVPVICLSEAGAVELEINAAAWSVTPMNGPRLDY